MPPVLSKKHQPQQNEASSDNLHEKPNQCLDLSDIINKAITNFKLQQDKRITKKRNLKYPCSLCCKSVKNNQRSIYCDNCHLWIHKKCEGLTDTEYQKLDGEDDDIPYSCLICRIREMSETFPFGLLSNFDLLDLYEIDLPSLLKIFLVFETQSKLTNLPNMNDSDIDENLPGTINSKCYNLNDLNKVKVTKNHYHSIILTLEVYQNILMSCIHNLV